MIKIMNLIGIKSRKASEKKINLYTKNKVLNLYAKLLDKENKSILRENLKDIKFAKSKGIKENLINRLQIDEGAKKALRSGKSLLAAGIKKILGKFSKGDHVKILDKKNNECARGLSSFTSDEIVKIMGHHSNQIEQLLGYVAKSEVIHKDDMVEI